MATTPAPDQELAAQLPERIGPFTITGILGRGGMGVVFDAVAPDGRRAALKVIRPYGDPERAELLIRRFLREAKILEQLDHPGVVKLIASGETEGVLYLAMERIEGVSLLTIRRQGSLAFEPLVVLGAQLAGALAHMHDAGVIHRDIKPANILIDRSGQPVITDFGISGMNEATGITRQGDLLGSPGFMAPEVIEGQTPSDRSDQFSLGRLLFELGATGPAKKLPRGAPILEVLRVALEIDWQRFPKGGRWTELEQILRKMLSTDPAERFTDTKLVIDAFKTLSNDDLLDSDTLSEHVDSLPVSTSWEVLAQDLNLDPEALKQQAIEDTIPPFPSGHPDERSPGGEEEPTQLDLDPPAPHILPEVTPPEVMRPQNIAEILEPPPEPAPPADAEMTIARLERQIARLRGDLDKARRDPPRAKAGLGRTLFAAIVALGLGAAAGFWAARLKEPPPPSVVLVAADPDHLAGPKYRYPAERGIPSAEDRAEARQMLVAATENLAQRDLEKAENLLKLCIEIADLPDCHKTLGSLLALTGDRASRVHFQHYLDVAPMAPDADQIREILKR